MHLVAGTPLVEAVVFICCFHKTLLIWIGLGPSAIEQQSRFQAAFASLISFLVKSSINMDAGGFEFGNEHSAEWVYSIQATYPFWKEILKKFDIDVTNR